MQILGSVLIAVGWAFLAYFVLSGLVEILRGPKE